MFHLKWSIFRGHSLVFGGASIHLFYLRNPTPSFQCQNCLRVSGEDMMRIKFAALAAELRQILPVSSCGLIPKWYYVWIMLLLNMPKSNQLLFHSSSNKWGSFSNSRSIFYATRCSHRSMVCNPIFDDWKKPLNTRFCTWILLLIQKFDHIQRVTEPNFPRWNKFLAHFGNGFVFLSSQKWSKKQ